MKLYYATDVHGSEICWKKFISAAKFYEVDTLILGGDMTGKAIVPIIAQAGNKHKVTLLEQETILEGPEEVAYISSTPGKSDELFLKQALKTVERWMEYAEQKLEGTGVQCYVCPG